MHSVKELFSLDHLVQLYQIETHHHFIVYIEAFDFWDGFELPDKLVADLYFLSSSTVALEVVVDFDK